MATKKKTSSRKAATVAATQKKPASKKKPAAPKAVARKTAAKPAPARAGKSGLSLSEVSPGLTVNDVHKSLAFYRDVLGFAVGERWEDQGELRGVELGAGKTSFMIGQDDWKKGRHRAKGEGVRLYCTTDQDVDALAARVQASGGTLDHEPREEWGMRAFSLSDLDGYKITIAAKLKPKR